MEDIILARLGTEMEFKERVLNQKRWEKTRYWQDRKDRITAEPWTTANNRIRNSGVAKTMDDVLAGSTDPKERGVALKSTLKEATGLETALDQNGNIYAKMTPTMAVAAQNRSVAPQNVLIEVTKDNGKQEEFTLPGYQEYLRKRKDSGKTLTRDEEIMMDMNPNEVLSGANLMEGRVMFGSENPDHPGTHDYLDVNSVAGTFEDATRYGVMYYGGDVSYQTSYKDEQGRDVETRYMQAIDSDGTILNEKAYSPEAEKAFKKANAGMTYRTVTKPALREETFTAPRMKVVFDLDDDVNRGIGNKEYGTGSVLTRDFQQGERPYDSQPMSSENASASSTGVKPNYD
jgi:hypothetical protein